MKKYLKGIVDQYDRGWRGETDPHASRLGKLANRIGRTGLRNIDAEEAAMDAVRMRRFEQAAAETQGLNKIVFEVLKASAAIPREHNTRPLWGMTYVEPDGTTTLQWHAGLTFGTSKDPGRDALNQPVAEPLGILPMDSLDWAHNGVRIPVDNMSLNCSIPVTAEGEFGLPSTVVWINSRPYDANVDPIKAVMSETRDLTGQARFTIGPDGNISHVGVGREDTTGYWDEDVQLDAGQFLAGVYNAATKTAQLYDDISRVEEL